MNKIFLYSTRLNRSLSPVKMKELNTSFDVRNPDNTLLDLIFSVDPVSGLPQGDLAVFMGDNANPEIKLFIQQNLMNENPDINGLENLPTDVTNKFRSLSDDDIATFSRNNNESREEYAYRLRAFFAAERAKRAKDAADREYKKLVERVQKQTLGD